MFKYESQEVIDKMSAEEFDKYQADKRAFEANEVSKQVKEEVEKATKEMKEIISKTELEIKALNEKPKAEKNVTFESSLKEATEKNEQFLNVAKGGKQSGPIFIETKSVVTMGLDTTVEAVGSASQISTTRDTGIVSTIRARILKYLGAGVSVGSIVGDNKAMWIEELDEQGTPIFIGEGYGKTALSVRYEEREKKARKIGVYGKVTTEMMRNLPSLINYIKNNLMRRVDIKTEDQLFVGNDTGDNLAGLSGYATAYDGGGLSITTPSYADVFRGLALQVEKAFGIATSVFVNPDILANMDVEKSADGIYLMPPFRGANGNTVAGMRLISSNGLPSGVDFIGGDLSVVNVMFSDNMSIQIGLDGNDFTNNKKTILVEQELVQFVSANDTQVLVKGDMTTALAAITAGV